MFAQPIALCALDGYFTSQNCHYSQVDGLETLTEVHDLVFA